MRVLVLISLLAAFASSTKAQEFRTDAFGVAPVLAQETRRSFWADTSQTPSEVQDILLFVGQKSLVAGRDIGHAVTILIDQFGNLVADGTGAEIILNGEKNDVKTSDGIASITFLPGTVAGNFDAGVVSDDMQSARATYRVTADLSGITPQIVPQTTKARPENFVDFSTDVLTDQNGNIAPSGVGAQMVLNHSDGSFSVLSSTVLNGRAQGSFLIRDVPDGGQVTAEITGNTSEVSDVLLEELTLASASRVILRDVSEIRATGVEIGPVTTSAGHYLNDGANISVTLTGHSGKSVTRKGWVRDGSFETILTIDPSDLPFTARVQTMLGEELSIIEATTPIVGEGEAR